MSFWDAEDKIPVKQTRVAIQAEHGLNYTAGQKITINVPPTVQFFQPRESFLKFEVQLNQGATSASAKPVRLQLDPDAGGQVLIKDIRIHSGGAGAQLLEEYQDYNVLACLKYDYENDETLRSKRALTEGCVEHDQGTRGTMGTTKTNGASLHNNPYFAPYDKDGTFTDTNGVWGDTDTLPVGNAEENAGNKKVKCLLPLNTGIFQSPKVFPNLLTEGLRIEILLESAPRAIRMLESQKYTEKIRLAPMFHSAGLLVNGGGGDLAQVIAADGGYTNPTTWSWGSNALHVAKIANYFWVKRDNNMLNTDNFPFVVGESFTFVKNTHNPTDPQTGATDWSAPYFTSPAGGSGVANEMVIKSIHYETGTGTVGGAGTGGRWGLIRIEIEETATAQILPDGVTNWYVDGDGTWSMVSTSISTNDGGNAFSYTLSNTELVLQQLEMPAGYTRKMMGMMKSGGTLNYDFLSSTNYKYSQLKGDIVANIRLPLSQSRAKSILSVPTDATAYLPETLVKGTKLNTFAQGTSWKYGAYDSDDYTYLEKPGKITGGLSAPGTVGGYDNKIGLINSADGDCFSSRSGLVGIWDNMSNYQWFYNGQLNPNRQVDVSKSSTQQSISQQGLVELEKALAMAGIRPLSFKKFNRNAVIGRALSLQDGVYDTRGRDFNLQINYTKPDAPTKNKLWMNFVHHIRRLVIRGNQISLEI
jgi:hypothetical protein